MINQNNAPSGLDLSGCNVSVDGGKTSQTLAQFAKDIQDNNAQIASISQSATDAKTIAVNAQSSIKEINTNNFYSKDQTFKPNGILPLGPDGTFCGSVQQNGVVYSHEGYKVADDGKSLIPDPYVSQIQQLYSIFSGGSRLRAGWVHWSNNSKDCYTGFLGKTLIPDTDGSASIGMPGFAWDSIYSKTGSLQTSDSKQKTVISTLDDESETSKNVLKALYSISAKSYKMNDAIKQKGDKARIHIGYISQEVEQALKDNHVDPAELGMWAQEQIIDDIKIDTGKKASNGDPIYTHQYVPKVDENKQPVYRQQLRYTEIICALLEAHKQEIEALKYEVAALKAKVSV